MRDRFTVLTGIVLIGAGVLWLLEMSTDIDIPWEYVLPASLIAIGLVLVLGRSDGGGDGKPPSQFERPDGPRVP